MNTAIHNNVKLWRPLLLLLLVLLLSSVLNVAMSVAGTVAVAGRDAIGASNTATGMPCKQRVGMWGDPDPNIFYICDSAVTNTALRLRCPEGRGFFNGLDYYGCLPFEQWPACIAARGDGDGDGDGDGVEAAETPSCDAAHLLEPWDAADPNKFYMCLAAGLEPLLANCQPGRGFVNVMVAGNGGSGGGGRIVGCAQWKKWRSYMQCEDYY